MSDENTEYRIARLERLADENRKFLENMAVKMAVQHDADKGLLDLLLKQSEDFLFLMRLVADGANFKSENDRKKLLDKIASRETNNDQTAAEINGLKSLLPVAPPADDPPAGGGA